MDGQEEKIRSITDNLSHIVPVLGKIFLKGVRAKTNLAPQTLQILGALWHHGKLTMTSIGNHLSVSKPHVTALVDKLISEELVERLNDERDRRIIYIQLTEKGRVTFKEVKAIMAESLRTELLHLEADKLNQMQQSAAVINDIILELAQRMSVGPCCSSQSNPE